jgi:hypothetical protein
VTAPPMSIVYLVVKATGDCRLLKSVTGLGSDEFAYRVKIKHPAGWGTVIGEIEISTPPPPDTVNVEQALRQLKDHLDHP